MASLLLTCFLSGRIMSIFIQSLIPDTWESCLIPPSLILPEFSLSPCALILPQICPVSLSASTKFIIISEFLYCKSLIVPITHFKPLLFILCAAVWFFFSQKQKSGHVTLLLKLLSGSPLLLWGGVEGEATLFQLPLRSCMVRFGSGAGWIPSLQSIQFHQLKWYKQLKPVTIKIR